VAHRGRLLPLVESGTRVVVDGHLICHACGAAIQPAGADRWRHVPAGRTFSGRSRWLSPVTLGELRRLDTYHRFALRYPSAVRGDFGGRFATTEAHWREGRDRLERYAAAYAQVVRRRRPLEAGEDPYNDLVALLAAPWPGDAVDAASEAAAVGEWGLPVGLSRLLDLRQRRRDLVSLFAWSIPSAEALALLARHAPLVEAAAGMGYWAGLLRVRGVDVVAYDLHPPGTPGVNAFHDRRRRPWTTVAAASSVQAVRSQPARTLLLAWPPFDDDTASYDALRAYRRDVFLYIGEPGGGATGTPRFERELALNWRPLQEVVLPTWPRVRDRLVLYQRNERRLPLRERDRCDECRRFMATGSVGRCDRCFTRHPPALAMRVGEHRLEYSHEQLAALPFAHRRALEQSRDRIR
jgi:hypothetical protein